jgi:hypothetical protein
MIYFSDRVKMIFSFPANAIVAEIGVFKGDFARLIQEIRSPKELYLIDLWESQEGEYSKDVSNNAPLNQYYENVCNQFKVAAICDQFLIIFTEGVSMFPDNYFDWIYLDADHSYASVKRDLNAWFPKIKNGGIFSGHDYVARRPWPDVKYILEEFMIDNNLELFCFTCDDPSSWAFKK